MCESMAEIREYRNSNIMKCRNGNESKKPVREE